MKTTKVLLTRKWSDWGAGDVVELEAEKAKRVIAKGYGVESKPAKTRAAPEPPSDSAVIESADAVPAAETATVTPQVGRQRGKGK
jgi:hypothetical protein